MAHRNTSLLQLGKQINNSASARHTDTQLCFSHAHRYTPLLQPCTQIHISGFNTAHRYTALLQHGTQINTPDSAQHTETHLCFSMTNRYTPLLQLGKDTHLCFNTAQIYTPLLQHGTQIHTSASAWQTDDTPLLHPGTQIPTSASAWQTDEHLCFSTAHKYPPLL